MKNHLKSFVAIVLLLCYIGVPITTTATNFAQNIQVYTKNNTSINGEQDETSTQEDEKVTDKTREKQLSTKEQKNTQEGIMPANENIEEKLPTKEDGQENVLPSNYGKVEIKIQLDFATNLTNYEMILTSSTDNSRQKAVIVKEENRVYGNFEHVPNGEYVLTIKNKGHINYTRNLVVNGEMTSIILSNKSSVNDMILSQNKYGLICIGDLNADGTIDETDENIMIEAINKGTYQEDLDLNGDGLLTITDLSYITYNKQKTEQGVYIQTLLMDKTKVEVAQTTQIVNGTVEDIFMQNAQGISLSPKSEGEITKQNPVEVTLSIENTATTEGIVIAPSTNRMENTIEEAEFTIVYEDGSTEVLTIGELEAPHLLSLANTSSRAASAKKEQDGTIVIDLNGQVAIKQITIKVTKTSGNKLADIGQVQFLNDMESRIPAPTMNIPTNIIATPGDEEFKIDWDKQSNVTGYEVKILSEGITQIIKTDVNTLKIKKFNNKDVKNYTMFEVQVQSVNGEWSSGYGETAKVVPMPTKVPDAPDNVSVTGGYRLLNVSWKDMKSTRSYTVYYKEYDSQESYQSISNITGTSTMITGLKDKTKYKVYVTGTNEIGTSKPSLEQVATTTDVNPPITSNYKLINTPVEGQDKTAHIASVSYPGGNKPNSEFAVVDNDYTTAWTINSWDGGGFNDTKPSPIIEFEQPYTLDRLVVIPAESQPANFDYFYAKTQYWDENGVSHIIDRQYTKKTSSNGKIYYEFEYKEPIIAKKIQINFALYLAYGNGVISIAEMKFYHYDSLEQDIYDLYADQMHVTLKETVTEQILTQLQTRLDTKDPVSEEYHPKKDLLQKELDTAKAIAQDKQIKQAIQIDTSVSKAYDSHITFKGGLTAMQPLGTVAYSGETINIYVGSPNKKTGDNTNLSLVATQYHAEASSWIKTVTTLKVGKNEITIPRLQSIDVEHGGALYVEYTGKNTNDIYGVRVSGGMDIPILDITKVQTETQKRQAVENYVQELESYVPTIANLHEEHQGEEKVGNYAYDEKNCIAGATDIVMDNMMLSVSSQQILNALTGTTQEKANQLYESLVAMEDMIDLFYSHKGLSNKEEAGAKNQLPTSRLNIRYQRMFAGAFMYAGGLHIGIEWGSISGMAKSKPVVANEQGLYQTGNYFGWGIAHEIGHIINEPTYAIAEITNNYFSVLAQAKDTNDSVRFLYENVYKKVTSNTTGRDSNVFTQLGMYWQLHLAYDKGGYNYKKYDNYQDQFNNLIFARMDTYARDVSKAPSPNGVTLTLNGGTDNNFMRLASAASQKNLIEFFTRWGLVPDETTLAYIEQFPKEEKAIYYINDDARSYTLAEKPAMEETTKVQASLFNEKNSNQVKISLANTASNQETMLGYEIVRVEYYKDQIIKKAVGFIEASQTEFVDTIATVNHRTFTYEITAFDQYLNQTQTITLEEIKISHDGSLDKTNWEVSTNMVSEEDEKQDAQEDKPCEPETVSAITKVIDKQEQTTYKGTTTAQNAEVIMDLKMQTQVTALKYTVKEGNPITNYEIYVSKDKKEWEKVQSGKFTLEDGVTTVYFNKENDPQMYIYDARYVKLVAKNQKNQEVAISEIDILGPTGDNIELLPIQGEQTTYGIGILKDTYTNAGVTIPEGSLVFTGAYKGNPAYNAVLLWDENQQIVGGITEDGSIHAKQILLADVPEKGELGETSNGTWIYWIEPDILNTIPKQVRAELYRVDNALTLEGERLVSNTLQVTLPEVLPEITIHS
ncbi:MAG: M60 family metallopeptidase [Clostridia bacterium]